MSLVYLTATDGPLRQTEILQPLQDLQAFSTAESEEGTVQVRQISHPLAMVVSQDCDLEQDFNARFPTDGEAPTAAEIEANRSALSHVLLCPVYAADELKGELSLGSKEFRSLRQNQMERYHCLEEAGVEGGELIQSLVVDFRRCFGVPVDNVYRQVNSGESQRYVYLPAYYLHDVAHRLHAYLSRVAIPLDEAGSSA